MTAAPEPSAATDLELVRRTKAGDASAFEQLVLKYQTPVYNAANRMLGHPDDAAETTQEVFLQLFRSISNFREEARFATYMWRTVINCVNSVRRKRLVRKTTKVMPFGSAADENSTEIDPPAGIDSDPERQASGSEARRAVTAAIAELDDDFKAVVLLKEIEGKNYDEIALILNTPVGTVKSRLHRARCQLRERLADYI